MGSTRSYSAADSNAFIEQFELGPWRGGRLSGLQFAVSDLIDIEDRPTGCGNPVWLEKRPPAACNALIVDLLLSSGAQCVGKTKSDEFTFSLLGENSFSGTPLNPKAPDRVPGGSGGGAASAVACGLVQFALALDSGTGTQVSASNCGLYGWRPRTGTVPMAGVFPVSPSFDTVGVLSSSAALLSAVAELFSLLNQSLQERSCELYMLSDALAKCGKDVRKSFEDAVFGLEKKVASRTKELQLKQISSHAGMNELQNWYKTYLALYYMESWSSIGTWIEERKPELGAETRANIHKARLTDRSESAVYFQQRESYARIMHEFLGDRKIICTPAVPEVAPKKGFIAGPEDPGSYYPNTISLASLASVAKLAQLTVPLAHVDGVPVGLNFMAADESILLLLLKNLERD